MTVIIIIVILLIVIGLVQYGLAKIALIGVLIAAGIVLAIFLAMGIAEVMNYFRKPGEGSKPAASKITTLGLSQQEVLSTQEVLSASDLKWNEAAQRWDKPARINTDPVKEVADPELDELRRMLFGKDKRK
jgi:hypothetical protein